MKTTLCTYYMGSGTCSKGSACAYAHGPADLRGGSKGGGKGGEGKGKGKGGGGKGKGTGKGRYRRVRVGGAYRGRFGELFHHFLELFGGSLDLGPLVRQGRRAVIGCH